MTCQDFEQLIALEVAGDLSGRESAPVQAHLEQCESCRRLASDLSADLEWLQTAHREQPDRAALHQVRVGVMRRLEAEQGGWNRPFGGIAALGWRWQWVVTAAVLIVAGASAWWSGVAWWSRPVEHRAPTIALSSADEGGLPERRPTPGPDPSVARGAAPAETPAEDAASTSEAAALRYEERARTAEETAARESVNESAPKTNHDPEPRREVAAAPQLARLEPAPGQPITPGASLGDPLGGETNVELVTARLDSPQETPEETVMLKIPTANPDIVVYWLMDEEERPQSGEADQGD